jgi:hypothetical protein
MSADDEEHSEKWILLYVTEDIILPSIDRNDVLSGSFIRVREGRLAKFRGGGGLKK